VQVPALPALHASHWPSQAVLQHTPSTQWSLAHSLLREHVAPLVETVVQTPARQNCVAAHSVSTLHPRQLVAPQPVGGQVWVRAAGQVPEPSQNSASVARPALASHEGERHCVVRPGITQACVSTAPSQVPLQPVPLPGHAEREPTGGPVTGEHVPASPGTLQASHWPVQSLLQQTPSTHEAD
jgi:hypothetical protein